jgi:hypothetical protein
MGKKILYLDMDGVVADFEKRIGELEPELQNFKSYEDQEALGDRIDQICYANPDIYHDLPPIEGAIEAVESNTISSFFQLRCGLSHSLLLEKGSGLKTTSAKLAISV